VGDETDRLLTGCGRADVRSGKGRASELHVPGNTRVMILGGGERCGANERWPLVGVIERVLCKWA